MLPLVTYSIEQKEAQGFPKPQGGLKWDTSTSQCPSAQPQAYEAGYKPLSKWTKSEIIKNIVELGVWSENELKKYPKHVLCEMFLEYQGWHHTSKMYNQTIFYGINLDKAETHDVETLNGLLDDYKETAKENHKKAEQIIIEKAFIRFETWEGTRRHPHLVEHEAYALIIGSTAYMKDGHKDLNGSHILSVKKFQRAPRGTAKIFARIQKNLPAKYRS